jgi:hypothetical protein
MRTRGLELGRLLGSSALRYGGLVGQAPEPWRRPCRRPVGSAGFAEENEPSPNRVG